MSHLDANFLLVRFDRLRAAESKYLRAMAKLDQGLTAQATSLPGSGSRRSP